MSSSPALKPTNQPNSPDPRSRPRKDKVDGLFEELEKIQREAGFLPLKNLREIAEQRGLDKCELHAVASYYPHFFLEKQPRVKVRVCDDMSCHLRGGGNLYSELEKKFKKLLGKISDEEMVLDRVSCLGRCDQAPVFEINGCYYDGFTSQDAQAEVQVAIDGGTPASKSHASEAAKEMLGSSVQLQNDAYDGKRPYSALRHYAQKCSNRWESLLAELETAKLRGMGGAGFPTHQKWRTVRASSSPEKYVICNADESEPGTIKDRYILTCLPHLVVEGMILAGLCVGAKQGYIYIRHEYKDQIARLKAELDFCHEENLLGDNILDSGHSFKLDLFVSPGGYICGEETALLEAIEGKRAEPRNKPPQLAACGLWNKPTIVNNVETLAFAAGIAHRCSGWFTEWGNNGFAGRKFVGISGDVCNPGVYEAPLGITYHELIYGQQYGGGLLGDRELIAFAPSGPSSGYLPGCMAKDLKMYWEPVKDVGSMMGSCAIVVCGEGTCMLDMALNAVRFYKKESCGKCVPCRIGSHKMLEILERWTKGISQNDDDKTVEELSYALEHTSICGLGQILPAPVKSVLKYFKNEVNQHFQNRNCQVCFGPVRG